MIVISMLAFVGILALSALAFILYNDPATGFSVLFGFLFAIGTIFGAFVLTVQYEKVKQRRNDTKKANKPDGLLSMKYRAFKNKICPVVEFEDNQ